MNHKQNEQLQYVYIDYTVDMRPFYVGIGNEKRLRKRERNTYWVNIANKHGWTPELRTVVFVTRERRAAFDLEIDLIASLKTYYYDGWGANFTRGGEGCRGRHPLLERVSQYVKKTSPHGNLGKRRSYEWRMSRSGAGNAMFGKKHPGEWKQKKSEMTTGENNPHSVLTWDKVREIRTLHSTGELTLGELAKQFQVQKPAIFKIVHHLTWKEDNK